MIGKIKNIYKYNENAKVLVNNFVFLILLKACKLYIPH